VALGAILLIAGALKAHHLATEPVAGAGWINGRISLMIQAEIEILFGLWLFGGLMPRLSWAGALGCFVLFTGVTLYRGITGEASCGCFGKVSVNPWYTLVLDLGAIAALLWQRPDLSEGKPAANRRGRLITVAAAGVVLCVAAGAAMAMYTPARLGADGQILGDDPYVFLEPATWPGKRLPLLRHIVDVPGAAKDANARGVSGTDVSAQLAKGQWTAVLYRHNCSHCQESVPRFEKMCLKAGPGGGFTKVAMIELPPYAPPGKSLLAPDSPCVQGRLSDRRQWFVQTPVALFLADGAVTGLLTEGDEDAGAAATAARKAAPPIATKDGAYDFGFVEVNGRREVSLTMPNPLKRAVAMGTVYSDCVCLKGTALTKKVSAGGNMTVHVVFIAPKKPIKYDRRLILRTDPPGRPPARFRIKANVGMPLTVDPIRVNFGRITLGKESRRTFAIRNRGTKPIRLTNATGGSLCTVALPPVVAAGSAVSVPVTVKPSSAGPASAIIQIRTNHGTQTSLIVPVNFHAAAQ